MPNSSKGQTPARSFPVTRWSVVVAAQAQPTALSLAALETLCQAYWYPLYSFARRSGQTPHDAQDLTQEFFRHLLEKKWLDAADREKGRLRTFLITAMKHFMAKQWRRANAQRRGGGQAHVTIDTQFAESRFASDSPGQFSAEHAFDRQWALTLIELTMNRLRREFTEAAKLTEFETLKSCLTASRGALHYPDIARKLGLSDGAARVAVHRLRKRFRQIYREEISQTLSNHEELETELAYLAGTLKDRL